MSLSLDDFLELRKTLPIADVRSEGEYAEGHIPQANNIPILNNEERKEVGTDYKQKGQQAAIMTGFKLVGPRLSEIVVAAEKTAGGDPLLVHCWRGGMRSANFCRFVEMAKVKTHSLEGGYKTYRQRAVESFAKPLKLVVIGGCTGSGKSTVIQSLKEAGEQVIDLEQLANHKGSVFGGLMMPKQPTTEQFQNLLFEDILRLDPSKRIWIEDESMAIGRIFLPQDFWKQLSSSPVVELEVSKSDRIGHLVEQYGKADKEEFLEAMTKIVRRLGGQHFNAAKEKLFEGDWHSTIDILLTYYDRAYQFGLDGKKQRIVRRMPWDGKDNGLIRELISLDLNS